MFILGRFLILLVGSFIPLIFYSQTLALVANNIPIGSRVYRDIDRLASYGLIQSYLASMKPLSRIEVGRVLAEALRNWENKTEEQKKELSAVADLLKKMEKTYEEEIEIVRGWRKRGPSFIKPLEGGSLRYNYLDGSFPIYNNEGVDYSDGHNLVAEFQSAANFRNILSLYLQPLLLYNENSGGIPGDEDTKLSLHKAYIKLGLRNFETELGRDSLWWGPGYHGSLLISNNAKPFDMLKISNPHPTLLPWVFSYLGPFQFNLILSELGEERPVPEPDFYGLRFNFKPHPLFEMGLSHIALFGGEGRDLSFTDRIKIIFGNKTRTGKLDSNQQVAVDVALRIPNIHKILPLAYSAKLYGEWGAEDVGFFPDRRAFLVGGALSNFLMVENLRATVEYVDTSPSSRPRAWYTHPLYPPTYEGNIFGHHVGTDAEDLFFELSYDINDKMLGRISLDHERRGVSRPNPEKSYQGKIGIEYTIIERATVGFTYGYEEVSDLDNISGLDQTNHLGEFMLHFQF